MSKLSVTINGHVLVETTSTRNGTLFKCLGCSLRNNCNVNGHMNGGFLHVRGMKDIPSVKLNSDLLNGSNEVRCKTVVDSLSEISFDTKSSPAIISVNCHKFRFVRSCRSNGCYQCDNCSEILKLDRFGVVNIEGQKNCPGPAEVPSQVAIKVEPIEEVEEESQVAIKVEPIEEVEEESQVAIKVEPVEEAEEESQVAAAVEEVDEDIEFDDESSGFSSEYNSESDEDDEVAEDELPVSSEDESVTVLDDDAPANNKRPKTCGRNRLISDFFGDDSSTSTTTPNCEGCDDPQAFLLRVDKEESTRKHRKVHGKISLKELTKLIASRWKYAKRDVYQNLAMQDKLRYKEEMDALKLKKNKEMMNVKNEVVSSPPSFPVDSNCYPQTKSYSFTFSHAHDLALSQHTDDFYSYPDLPRPMENLTEYDPISINNPNEAEVRDEDCLTEGDLRFLLDVFNDSDSNSLLEECHLLENNLLDDHFFNKDPRPIEEMIINGDAYANLTKSDCQYFMNILSA